jgi:hypothetical protein
MNDFVANAAFTTALTVVGGLLILIKGALIGLYLGLRSNEREFARYREFVATHYAPKTEIGVRMDQLENKLDRALNGLFRELRTLHTRGGTHE